MLLFLELQNFDLQRISCRGNGNLLNCRGNFLYLRRSFHEGLRSDTGDTGDWERLPLANTLQKLRLENTKVAAGLLRGVFNMLY